MYGPTGLPVIRGVVAIAGNNSTIRRAASAPDFRIFAMGETGDLMLRRTTASGGRMIGDGGGVYIYRGSATLINTTVSGNTDVHHADTDVGGIIDVLTYIPLASRPSRDRSASTRVAAIRNLFVAFNGIYKTKLAAHNG